MASIPRSVLALVLGLLWLAPALSPGWAAPTARTTVLMIQWRGETNAERGFKQELSRQLGSVQYLTFNAGQDKDRLLDYLHREFLATASRIDYVYSFGTTASQTVMRVLPEVRAKRIVHLINVVADPVSAKLADSLAAAGPNRIVGCHLVSLDAQLRNASRLLNIRRMGIIFNAREANSSIQLEQMTTLAGRMGFALRPLRIRPERKDLEEAVRQFEERKVEVDCVYLLSDSFLVSNARWVIQRLNAARIPTIAANEPLMKEGALTGTIASYYKMGQLVARAAAQDARSTQREINLPVILDPDPEFLVNLLTAGRLDLKVDERQLAGARFLR